MNNFGYVLTSEKLIKIDEKIVCTASLIIRSYGAIAALYRLNIMITLYKSIVHTMFYVNKLNRFLFKFRPENCLLTLIEILLAQKG